MAGLYLCVKVSLICQKKELVTINISLITELRKLHRIFPSLAAANLTVPVSGVVSYKYLLPSVSRESFIYLVVILVVCVRDSGIYCCFYVNNLSRSN